MHHNTYKLIFCFRGGVKPKTHSPPAPVFLWTDISWQLSHNSSLSACLCWTWILFVVTFPWPSHLSTWKTLMRLQHDIKASLLPRHSLRLFRFMALFFPLLFLLATWKDISVSPTDVCELTHMDVHVYTGTLRPKQSCQIRVVNKSNETPTEFQREEVRAKQWRDKMTEGGGKQEWRMGGVDTGDCTSLWK